jgi:hypothetical protein
VPQRTPSTGSPSAADSSAGTPVYTKPHETALSASSSRQSTAAILASSRSLHHACLMRDTIDALVTGKILCLVMCNARSVQAYAFRNHPESRPPSGSCRLLAASIECPTSIPMRCSCHRSSHYLDPASSARSHLGHEGCTRLVVLKPPRFGRPTCYTPSCCCTHRSTHSSCPRASSQRSRAANCNR